MLQLSPSNDKISSAALRVWTMRVAALILPLISGCLSGDLNSLSVKADVECTPLGEHNQYAVYEYQIQRDDRLVGTDIDGDGLLDNAFGQILLPSWTGHLGSSQLPATLSIGTLVNGNLQKGRGVLLIDAQADQTVPGCSRITLHAAAQGEPSAPHQVNQFNVLLGNPPVHLPSWGIQQELASASYARMNKSANQAVDLYFPLIKDVIHLRLYGVRVSFTQSAGSEDEIEGLITGVLKKDEFMPNILSGLADEFTQIVNNSSPDFLAKLKYDLRRIEDPSQSVSQNKCLRDISDCCFPLVKPGENENDVFVKAAKTCKILPAELAPILTNNTIFPDLSVFENNQWKRQKETPQSQHDSYSLGLSFKARRATITQTCPSGSFCQVPLPPEVTTWSKIMLGWAANSSDLWLAGENGELLRHDGFSWSHYVDADPSLFSDYHPHSIWGGATDDIWMGGHSPDTWRHWDGVRWRRAASKTISVNAMHGTSSSDIWAAVNRYTDDDSDLLGPSLLHYNGTTWEEPINRSDVDTFRQLFSPQPGILMALGEDRNLSIFSSSGVRRLFLPSENPGSTRSLWGNSATDVWFMSGGPGGGSCSHYDGQLTYLPNTGCDDSKAYNQVWGDARGVLWAAGSGGLLKKYDPAEPGGNWRDVPNPLPQIGGDFYSVFGVPQEGAVWALGTPNLLLRYQP